MSLVGGGPGVFEFRVFSFEFRENAFYSKLETRNSKLKRP